MNLQKFEDIRDYPKFWAQDLVPAKFLPMSREEMDELGWDSCDIIIVTGDAYVDHPSFCTAIVGRYLESFGYRVGVISQPDWRSKDDFMKLGRPNLFFGVNAGNMDSMINHYTADRKIRTDDAYTPNNVAGKRPDRAVTVYSQRIREAFKDIPVVIGGIEASLRRMAHYDYWSDTVKNSVLVDSKADILVYGNGERPLAEIAYRLSMAESVKNIKDIRGTAVMVHDALPNWVGIDSRSFSKASLIEPYANPYNPQCQKVKNIDSKENEFIQNDLETDNDNNVIKFKLLDERINYTASCKPKLKTHELEYILLPNADKVKQDKKLYAHAHNIFINETNPECARALMQKHGERYVWINPPSFVLTTDELDYIYALPFTRIPHPSYEGMEIPAYEMIKTSVSIMRGCFGGCSFCSIVAHEGKRIQSRSEESILNELEEIKEKTDGFTGVISDLGGPSANMYKLQCNNEKARKVCRKPSCLYPEPCQHLETDHSPLIALYRKARELPFIKKILVASGVRIDLALLDKRYIKELVMHHVGGYLKIAPEHTEKEVLSLMLKPSTDVYYRFKELFDSYSSTAKKVQYLIPYFMSSHPGSDYNSMIKLAQWLKRNDFKLDQVQNFYPTPLAGASTMYHTGFNPYEYIDNKSEPTVYAAKGEIARRTQKSILRYHDKVNHKVIREVLTELGLTELIGMRKECLVPPSVDSRYSFGQRSSLSKTSNNATCKNNSCSSKDNKNKNNNKTTNNAKGKANLNGKRKGRNNTKGIRR